MAVIHDLLAQVQDEALRARIENEFSKFTKTKKYGIVFEEHLPECTLLYDIPVKKGSQVARRSGSVNDVLEVVAIKENVATCVHKATKTAEEIPLDDLVSVAEFGEPIFPYLKPVDSICNAPDIDLWHTLIEADNYHALQLLEYLYAGKVDCIYIDPPYNTGAKDWKYNNDYVDDNDSYRHSKWLSMMKKRLALAWKLLKPTGIIVITIDDYEYAALKLLSDELFSLDNYLGTICIRNNPSGRSTVRGLSVNHEYALLYSRTSEARMGKMEHSERQKSRYSEKDETGYFEWENFRKNGTDSDRADRPKQFYPIYLNTDTLKKRIPSIQWNNNNNSYDICEKPLDNETVLWPISASGEEKVWKYGIERARTDCNQFKVKKTKQGYEVYRKKYLNNEGSAPHTWWDKAEYSARDNGTRMLTNILGSKSVFDFPKALNSVKDSLIIANLPSDGLVVDFFAGSGTTLHAVNLLNALDGGKRQCILVTNNEVSESETKVLAKSGYKPGDEEWEKWGIARHVTWPRTVCSIKGVDINGNPLKGNYISTERAMSEGFKANAAFFKLGFLDKTAVALGRQLREMIPLLWLKAGAHNACPKLDINGETMIVLPYNKFAVLINENYYQDFVAEVQKHPEIKTIYIVTDSDAGYREMISEFSDKDTYQLYRDYLDNFRINTGR